MKFHFKLAAAALFLIGTAVGAQAEDHCGMSNGQKASGEPIQLGAIVGRKTFLPRPAQQKRISNASTPMAASRDVRSFTRSRTTIGIRK
jgi:hypothetical protein